MCIALTYLNVGKKERMDLEMMLTSFGPNYKNLPRGLSFLTGGQIQPKMRENKDNPNLILDRHCPKMEAALNDINPDHLSPKEALELLYKLKAAAQQDL